MKVLRSSSAKVPVLCVSLLFSLPLVAQQAASVDPKISAALHEATDFHQRGQLSSALESAQKAIKLSKGAPCEACYREIVNLQIEMDLLRDADVTASAWVAHAGSPQEKATAEYLNAKVLLLSNRQKHGDALLQRADRILHQAALDNPSDASIHLLNGRVLALLKKDADAKAQFAACSSTPGATALQCRRADAYAHDTSLASSEEAPEFTISREDGPPVTLDSLAGKIVLVDFWATWCGPCARDLDYVQSIAEEFAKDKFVLLGVSTDTDEEAWKNHVRENRMIGIQVRDRRHALNDLFKVDGIPTYFIIDGNGMIRFQTTGALKDLRTRVRELMKEVNSRPLTLMSAKGD